MARGRPVLVLALLLAVALAAAGCSAPRDQGYSGTLPQGSDGGEPHADDLPAVTTPFVPVNDTGAGGGAGG